MPWREYAPNELEQLAGDNARASKYAGRARRIEKVLPPSLQRLVSLTFLDYGKVLEVEIRGNGVLNEADAERLKRICLRTLRGEKVGKTDGQWRDRKLRSIDPHHVFVRAPVGEFTGPVAVNATALEAGEFVVGASQAGWLPVGHVETSPYSSTLGFRPTFCYRDRPL